jgi:hypothetical protein
MRLVKIGAQRYVNPDAVLWVEWYDFNTEGGPPQVDLHLADGETLRVVSSVDKILAALQGEERTQYVRQERAT